LKPELDHLAFLAPNLEQGMEVIESLLGVRPQLGGQHSGRGTHNALLGLGTGVYLEVIAPDPHQPEPKRPRAFGLDEVREPRLGTWIARTTDLTGLVASSRASGYDPGNIVAMSRKRPDGDELRWTMALRDDMPGDGLIPSLIDWGESPHPSDDLSSGGTLVDLRAEHPLPDDIRRILSALQLDLVVTQGPTPALIATIDTDRGRVELR
jgi:hypothetical protein